MSTMHKKCVLFLGFVCMVLCTLSLQAKTLVFSNLTWNVRNGTGGPGPNNWSDDNAWVDSNGWLHLRITNVEGVWYCPEVSTTTRLGFGQYWFYVIGNVDTLDPNVVLGLFNYPTPDVGPDGTNEIDIEFSRWGSSSPGASNASYTVWPRVLGPNQTSLSYTFSLGSGNYSTHGFVWKNNRVFFQSGYGHYKTYPYPIMSWLFSPPDYSTRIPQNTLPVHINLWLMNGNPPTDGNEVEVIIKRFYFTPQSLLLRECSPDVMEDENGTEDAFFQEEETFQEEEIFQGDEC